MRRVIFRTRPHGPSSPLSPHYGHDGNVTQLIIDAVDLAGGATVDASAAIRARMRRFCRQSSHSPGGAVAGAVGFSKFASALDSANRPCSVPCNRHATVGQP